jgi:ATP-binding cassette subfamily E protein 1
MNDPVFQTDVVKALSIDQIKDKNIDQLSGGELQRVTTLCCLATEANIYLLDEPSANLDIEQRAVITKIIKRFALHFQKAVFVVEHDIMMATSLASEDFSNVIVFSGENRTYLAERPKSFTGAMNKFLQDLNITLRTDRTNGRPRINRIDSGRDREQKSIGKFID